MERASQWKHSKCFNPRFSLSTAKTESGRLHSEPWERKLHWGKGMSIGNASLPNWKKGGYRGPLSIEREEPDAERRLRDIRMGLAFLKELQLYGG